MSKSVSDLIEKHPLLSIEDILDIYLTARSNTLLELKDKIKGYPLNGTVGGVILEKDIDMWITNIRNFQTEQIEVLRNKQSVFELKHIPLKKSIIAYIMPSKILTVDIDKVEGKNCFLTEDYAEMLELGDIIEFRYLVDDE